MELKDALLLTDINKLEEEIFSRKELLSQMVGTLYPSIVQDELTQLYFRRSEIQYARLDDPKLGKILLFCLGQVVKDDVIETLYIHRDSGNYYFNSTDPERNGMIQINKDLLDLIHRNESKKW